ncbi:Nickel-transporting ATPase [Gloeocapsa sp. PCC 7428]|uniref:ATP-binding cassette domain-containing protein n=1 Tax=Gloeocapsa sp. PCC 7428 TaxID=1173026 RepID=UPI0002A5F6A7|nr:dipeptide/oligopeptide/nickel ABC transporter ATP-binding protein [Gloeocapsa sp. PCC 7428]AFZ31543.1 Nickel-transporting ATPase [Gloeocapsa sp. PCC 7428]
MTLLSIQKVSKTYEVQQGWWGQKHLVRALQEVSLTVEPGCCLGVVGESGAGKSTLGRIVLGLEQPDRGEIWFQGKNLRHLNRDQRRILRRDLQVVFQDSLSAVNPRLSVREIIGEPMQNYLNLSTTQMSEQIQQLLEIVGLRAADIDKYPHQFSGGQLQRVTIARAIALKPKLIVLDEPVASLDMTIQAQILHLLADLKEQFELSYLFISHDLAAVSFMANKLAVMYQGAIVETVEDLKQLRHLQHPYAQQLMAAQLPSHPRDRLLFTS